MAIAPTPVRRRHAWSGFPFVSIGVVVLLAGGIALFVRFYPFQGSSSGPGTQGSGTVATQARAVASFTGVELAGSNAVVVHVGGPQSVVVHADDNLLDRVTTEVEAGRLVVDTTGGFTTKAPMSVDVRVPSLDNVTLSGSGVVSVDAVSAERMRMRLSGSGVLRATGSVDRLVVTLDGSGDAELAGLEAGDVTAVVTGSGRILVHATSTLSASVPGTGAIAYTGDPARVTTSVTGTGAITRG